MTSNAVVDEANGCAAVAYARSEAAINEVKIRMDRSCVRRGSWQYEDSEAILPIILISGNAADRVA
jgi:hypothetical protein